MPDRKTKQPKVEQPVLTVFPTLTMRQAHILMHCVALGLQEGIIVDGHYVQTSEFEDVIRQLIRK